MNDLIMRRYLKYVLSYGIQRRVAEDIVKVAIECSDNEFKTTKLNINYAIDLTLGIGISKNEKNNKAI